MKPNWPDHRTVTPVDRLVAVIEHVDVYVCAPDDGDDPYAFAVWGYSRRGVPPYNSDWAMIAAQPSQELEILRHNLRGDIVDRLIAIAMMHGVTVLL